MFCEHKPKINCQDGDFFFFLLGAAVLSIKTYGHSAKTTKCLCIICRLTHCQVVILHLGLILSPKMEAACFFEVLVTTHKTTRCFLSLWRPRFSLRPIHVGFFSGWSGTRTGFSPNISVFHCCFTSTNASCCTLIHLYIVDAV
jgi:hypothetical protein